MDFNFEHEINKTFILMQNFGKKENCITVFAPKQQLSVLIMNLKIYVHFPTDATQQTKVINHGRYAPIIPQLSPF